MLGGLLRGAKDGALGLSIKALVNDKFSDFGQVQDCSIDTAKNRIVLKALLKGETQPITAVVERYELQREGEDGYIVLKGFSSSREWLGLLLGKLFTGKRYKLPSAVTSLL